MLLEQAERSFIGRVDVLQSFRANACSDEPARMLYAFSGEGGVGKTAVLDQLERASAGYEVPVVVVRCDDRQPFPVEVIAEVAGCLGELVPRDSGVKRLKAQLARYKRLLREVELDDDAPGTNRGLAHPVASSGVRLARHLPVVGAVAELVSADRAGTAADELTSYLRRRGRSDDDIRLMREPEQVLTPLAVDVVNTVAATGRRVLLFCDVFERTANGLENWLWQVLRSDHGDLDPWFIVTVAGRDELGQAFGEFGDAATFVHLQPFAFDETERYLAQRGITDAALVEVIHRDTAGLPALVELVASRYPEPGQALPDVSGDAVERFLSWVHEPRRRAACLYAAVPRWFDVEILTIVLDRDADDEFGWLEQEAFVRRPSSAVPGYHFHEKVRELMLRHLRNQRPEAVASAHARLAEHLGIRLASLALQGAVPWFDDGALYLTVQRAYHRVAAAPGAPARVAAEEYLAASRWDRARSYAIARSVEQALLEQSSGHAASPIIVLAEAFRADDRTASVAALDQLDRLSLSDSARSELYWLRWWATTDPDPALLIEAIRLDDTNFRAHVQLGYNQWSIGDHRDALATLTHAIALNPRYARAHANRGMAHSLLGHHNQAIADLTHAIDLDPNDGYAWTLRGSAHGRAGRHDQAIADLTHAIAINPLDAYAFARRGIAYAYTHRGIVHTLLGHHDQAIADLTHARKLAPNYAWAASRLALTQLAAGDIDGANTTFENMTTLKLEHVDEAGILAAWQHANNDPRATATATLTPQLEGNDSWDDLGRCLALIVQGQIDQARQLANGPVAADPDLMHWIEHLDLFNQVRRLITDTNHAT